LKAKKIKLTGVCQPQLLWLFSTWEKTKNAVSHKKGNDVTIMWIPDSQIVFCRTLLFPRLPLRNVINRRFEYKHKARELFALQFINLYADSDCKKF